MFEKSLPKTLVLCALICAGFGSAAVTGAETAVPIRDQYRINPGDVLRSRSGGGDLNATVVTAVATLLPLAWDMGPGQYFEQGAMNFRSSPLHSRPRGAVAALPTAIRYVIGQVTDRANMR